MNFANFVKVSNLFHFKPTKKNNINLTNLKTV